jgi:proteasome lid subunit RPN8/RPN11
MPATMAMFQALKSAARWLFQELTWSLRRARTPLPERRPLSRPLQPLRRVLLTDGVSRTLFEEYARHRAGSRGEEETGWLLLGHREVSEAVVLATLPAGTRRQAGVAHIQFNSLGQAVGSRIVRQHDRRLTTLGVVHTHPGTLRHPSDGDYRGDSAWVNQLRGKEGIFGIGTADGDGDAVLGRHPRPHMQMFGELCLSWYGLGQGDRQYRPLPVELILGPDLARPLHKVWPTIEAHAEQLDRLARQQAGIRFELVNGRSAPALAVTVPLAEPGDAIQVLIEGKEVRYVLARGGDYLMADAHEQRIDHGVYLLLAELAAQS